MYDNSSEIKKVYTMTFPETELIESILDKDEQNILIFSHHAQSWTSKERNGEPFISMENIAVDILGRMKKQNISLYSLHIPLDNYGEYSTGKCFAEALDLQIEKACCIYLNALTGVIGISAESIVSDFLLHHLRIGHAISFLLFLREIDLQG